MSANLRRQFVDAREFSAQIYALAQRRKSPINVLDFLIEHEAVLEAEYQGVLATLNKVRPGTETQIIKELGKWVRCTGSPASP